MKKTALLLACAFLAVPSLAETLTFEQALGRVTQQRVTPASAAASADAVDEALRRRNGPLLRVETGALSSNNVDTVERNVFRYDALTALLWIDYPLLDGGIRAAQNRAAKAETGLFRQRIRDLDENAFRETLEAAARLYAAQERLRILRAGTAAVTERRGRARQMLESQQITNATASYWDDAALGAEAQVLEAELQRLDAEMHLRQLMRDSGTEPLAITLDLEDSSGAPGARSMVERAVGQNGDVARASLVLDRRRIALEEAEAMRRTQLSLSAFGGVTSLRNVGADDDDGGYGLFGVRLNITLPMFDVAASRRVAEARMQLEQASLERTAIEEQIRARVSSDAVAAEAAERRIPLLEKMVQVGREREESMRRLVAAGMRQESEIADVTADLARRESDLLAARVERWKYRQLALHTIAAAAQPGASRP